MMKKNRKITFAVFVVLALLCLGIGYAALSDTLELSVRVNVDGSVDNELNKNAEDESKFNIVWVSALTDREILDPEDPGIKGYAHVTTATIKPEDDSASLVINKIGEKNERAFAYFTIKNESDVSSKATIIPSIMEYTSNSRDGITVSYYFMFTQADKTANEGKVASYQKGILNLDQGAQATLVVSVTVTEALASNESFSLGYKITLDAVDYYKSTK